MATGQPPRQIEAEQVAVQCVVGLQKASGREHADVAIGFVNLGYVYDQQRRYEPAQGSYEAGLKLIEKVFGPAHPLTAATRVKLAMVQSRRGEHAAAQSLIKTALPVYEAVYGTDDPQTETLYQLLQQVPPVVKEAP